MARCHWHVAEGERFFLPGCIGGAVYGSNGCTCGVRDKRISQEQRIFELEARVAELEALIRPERGTRPKIVPANHTKAAG